MSQKEKAVRFRELHHAEHILVLPNAWDVPSARVFEEAGFPAIATTSAGVSVALGYPDGENISRREMLEVVARIVKSVSVPVTADMEAGFGETVEEVAETAKRVILAGAVGLNIEDATRNPSRPLFEVENQIEKIKAIRRAAGSIDVSLVINARTDAFRCLQGDTVARLMEVVRRGKAYREAGADCVYAFGVQEATSISEIIKQLNCPVNIRAGPGAPTIPELETLGVARASLATSPICATLGLLKRIAVELRDKGTYEALARDVISYAELNKLASPKS